MNTNHLEPVLSQEIKVRTACTVRMTYDYGFTDECHDKLEKAAKYLRTHGIDAKLEEATHYGSCWRLTARGTVSVATAEDISVWMDDQCMSSHIHYYEGLFTLRD